MSQSNVSHFKDHQARIVAQASKERKEQEERRRKDLEFEYWEDYRWMIDRAYDGSDEQEYMPKESED